MSQDYERAKSALLALDAGCARDEWVKILASAKSAGIDFETADEWCSTAANYRDTKDVQSVWRGLRDTGGITENTLFFLARQSGWEDAKQSDYRQPVAPRKKPATSAPARKSGYDPQAVWDSCIPADASHPYIVRKQGMADGLRTYPADAKPLHIAGQSVVGWLVLPCRTPAGDMQSLQFIPPVQGKKLNLPGCTMAGGLHVVGEIAADGVAFVCEGISAAWAAWKATGRAAVVSFGWGNIKTIAPLLANHYPGLSLVLLPDVGKEDSAASIAADLPRVGWVALPHGMEPNSDVGDFAQAQGYDVLEELLSDGVKYPPKPEPRYRALSAADLAMLPPIRWRIKSLLPQRGIAALYGPSASGKSFLAIDLAAHIAKGQPWFGNKVRHAPVVYVCLEGAAGLRNRVAAWSKDQGQALPRNLHFITPDTFDLRNSADVFGLAETVQETTGPGCVLIIDTLAQAAPGADENSGQDMSQVLNACHRLQEQLQGLVLLVHHTGKDKQKGMRGHSSMFAAMDAVIEVVRTENGNRMWRIGKAKDGEDGGENPFRLHVVELDTDEDGDPVTSCVVRLAESVKTTSREIKRPAGGNQLIVYNALDQLLKESTYRGKGEAPPDRPCLRLETLQEEAYKRLVMDEKRKPERTTTAITGLINRGVISLHDGWVWML